MINTPQCNAVFRNKLRESITSRNVYYLIINLTESTGYNAYFSRPTVDRHVEVDIEAVLALIGKQRQQSF